VPGAPGLRSISLAVYRTTFSIAATAEAVWAILVDFECYPEWNPSLPSISGDVEVGSTVALTLVMLGRPPAKVRAKLKEVVPERRLCWHGNVGGDRLFAGTREFGIEPQPDDTVLFTDVEDVTGLLFPLFRAAMGGAIQSHHGNLNAALKDRAERPTPA
jgi:hypothetical protein